MSNNLAASNVGHLKSPSNLKNGRPARLFCRSYSFCRCSVFTNANGSTRVLRSHRICYDSTAEKIPNAGPKPEPNPNRSQISDFLLHECGLTHLQLSALQKRKPSLWRLESIEACRGVVALLREYGFSDSQLRKLLPAAPFILQSRALVATVEPLELRLECIRALGFTQDATRVLVTQDPMILAAKDLAARIQKLQVVFRGPENLFRAATRNSRVLRVSPDAAVQRMEFFRTLGLQTDALFRHILSHPELLTRSEDVIKLHFEFYRNLGVPTDSKTFLHAISTTIGYSVAKLQENARSFLALGLLDTEVKELLRKCPMVICTSFQKKKKIMDYLVQNAGLPANVVVACPSLLNLSLERRIRPRHAVHSYLLSQDDAAEIRPRSLPALPVFIALSEDRFLTRYVNADPLEAAKLLEIYRASMG